LTENEENTEVWSDGTPVAPVAPPAGSTQSAFPPPPASRPGPPIWLIGGGIVFVVLLVVVLAVLVARNMGAPKTAPTQAASSVAASSAAASTVAAPSIPPASSSVPATVQDAVNQFGLIGVWAADCTQPVSNNNYYQTFAATADGAVTDSINTGPDSSPGQYRFDTGHLIGSDQIALDGVRLTDGSAMQIVLQKDADGGLHLLQATVGGTQQVVNASSSGSTKCS
jgi:hypothetical protein